MQIITHELFMSGSSSSAGAWNAKQLRVLGVKWPPKKGWKIALIGKSITDQQVDEFLALTGCAKPNGGGRLAKQRRRLLRAAQSQQSQDILVMDDHIRSLRP